ncbi:pollen-specific leucine-rich repeat extensin-like protein 3 [Iris pallida]|uniref:Pollen-specific leucine-rich repeat extensin-like protein 3 n=1 Tax=Iris pallida TaxID=29817 RepID=A0AAX6FXN1_IRIPA|nr:pollen-specific leucine-rich repeat extensin-like protein 3 [Iris pallida]
MLAGRVASGLHSGTPDLVIADAKEAVLSIWGAEAGTTGHAEVAVARECYGIGESAPVEAQWFPSPCTTVLERGRQRLEKTTRQTWSGSDVGCGYAEELDEAHAELAATGLGDGNRPTEAAFTWRRIRGALPEGTTGKRPKARRGGARVLPAIAHRRQSSTARQHTQWLAAQARSRWGEEAVEVRALAILYFVVLFLDVSICPGCKDWTQG